MLLDSFEGYVYTNHNTKSSIIHRTLIQGFLRAMMTSRPWNGSAVFLGRGGEAEDAREEEAHPGASLAAPIPWGNFRPLLESAFKEEGQGPAGRTRLDGVILFKMSALQQLFNLRDGESGFQVNDRRSFEKFVGLGVMDSILDAATISLFREGLRKQGSRRNCLRCGMSIWKLKV